MIRKLLYLSGPFSADPVRCSRAAMLAATAIYRHTEFSPVVPHLTLMWDLLTPMSYEDWMTIDFAILARCHAITRLPGESPGAEREVEFAAKLGIPLLPFSNFIGPVQTAYSYAVGASL